MTTLSVLIPIFNGEEVIAQAVANILSQTVLPHEIVLADDGSTDGLKDRLPALAQLCAEAGVELVHSGFAGNRGRGSARNLALRTAAGELVAWYDADDLWSPRKLAVQLEAFGRLKDDHPPDRLLLTCNYARYSGRTSLRSTMMAVPPTLAVDDLISVQQRRHIQLQTVLGPRSAFVNAGMFDETLNRAEDFDFSVRYAAEGGKFVNADSDSPPLVHYFRSPLNRSAEAARQNAGIVAKLSRIFKVGSVDPQAFLRSKYGLGIEELEDAEGVDFQPVRLQAIAQGVLLANGDHPIRLAVESDGSLAVEPELPEPSNLTFVAEDGLRRTITRWSEPPAARHAVTSARLVTLFLEGARWLTLYAVAGQRMMVRNLRFRRAASGLITLGAAG